MKETKQTTQQMSDLDQALHNLRVTFGTPHLYVVMRLGLNDQEKPCFAIENTWVCNSPLMAGRKSEYTLPDYMG